MRLRTTVTLALLSSIGLMGCGPDDDSASSIAAPAANAPLSAANDNAAVSPAVSPAVNPNLSANATANAGPSGTRLAAAQPDTFPNEPPPVPPDVHYPPDSSSN